MPYTSSQLTTFYTNENGGVAPTAAQTVLLNAWAQQNSTGVLTDQQTVANVAGLASSTTDVALSTYQFYEGATPSIAGIQYLVNGNYAATDPRSNPNSLTSAYYTAFNTENRYYNFSMNLAFGNATDAANFANTYGSMTFNQAVTAAYETIVGTANVGATAAAAAIASIESSQAYFAEVAKERAPHGANADLATKAVMIGYILEEAQKADVGAYAKGVDQFVAALATTGTANTGNLLTNYPPMTGGQTVALTAGIDNIQLTGSGNTVNANVTSAATNPLQSFDVVNGGSGANNTFNINDVVTGAGASFALPASFTVTNIQNWNVSTLGNLGTGAAALTSATTAAATAAIEATAFDTTVDTGLQNLTVVATGTVGENIKASDTVNVTVSAGPAVPVDVFGGATVGVTGGASVNVEGAGLKTVNVTGATGTVYVDNSSVTGLNDGKGATLTTVNLTKTTGNATIQGKGVATVGLTGLASAQSVTVTNQTVGAQTLNVNLNGSGLTALGAVSGLQVIDATATTVAITATGANELNLTAAAATTVTVGGAGSLTLDAATNIKDGAKIDASANSGGVTITDNFTNSAILGGSGNDTVVVTSALAVSPTAGAASINLGGGNNSVLMGAAGSIGAGVLVNGGTGGVNTISASLINAGNVANISNFQVLDVSGYHAALDTALIGGGQVNALSITTADTGGVATLQNLGANVTITDAFTGGAPGSSLLLTHAGGSGTLAINFAEQTVGAATIASLQSTGDSAITIASGGKAGATNVITAISETDNHLASVTVTGSNALTLSAIHTDTGAAAPGAGTIASALTTIDASATTGGVTIVAGATEGNSVSYNGLHILGGTGGDHITNAAAGGVITEGATSALHVNTLVASGIGSSVDDHAAAGADVITLDAVAVPGVGANQSATLGSGVGVTVNVNWTGAALAFTGATGTVDTVNFGSGTANVIDDLQYGAVATAASAATNGNLLAFTGALSHNSIEFQDSGSLPVAGQLGAAVSVAAAQTFDQAVFAADAAAGGVDHVAWFQYAGNTYVLDTNSAAGTADDLVVKLAGTVDLSHAAFGANGVLTFA